MNCSNLTGQKIVLQFFKAWYWINFFSLDLIYIVGAVASRRSALGAAQTGPGHSGQQWGLQPFHWIFPLCCLIRDVLCGSLESRSKQFYYYTIHMPLSLGRRRITPFVQRTPSHALKWKSKENPKNVHNTITITIHIILNDKPNNARPGDNYQPPATTHHFISEVTYEIHEKRKEDFHVKIWLHEFAVKDN